MSEPTTPKRKAKTEDLVPASPASPSKPKGSVMSDADSKFLIECLKNTQGQVTIDLEAVAKALDYKNPRSVGNRLAVLKKVHGLGLITTTANSGGGASASAGSPVKGSKVTKSPRAPRKPRSTKGKKKQEVKSDTTEEDVNMTEDDDDEFEGVEEKPKAKPTPRRPRAKTMARATKPTNLAESPDTERIAEWVEGIKEEEDVNVAPIAKMTVDDEEN